jgi:hypothetical protein
MVDREVKIAAQEAVEAALQIDVLKKNLFNPPKNQAERDANKVTNRKLREQNRNLAVANAKLSNLNVERLEPSSLKYTEGGDVVGAWTFSHELLGTSQSEVVITPAQEQAFQVRDNTIENINLMIGHEQRQLAVVEAKIASFEAQGKDTFALKEEEKRRRQGIASLEGTRTSLEQANILAIDPNDTQQEKKQDERQEKEDIVRDARRDLAESEETLGVAQADVDATLKALQSVTPGSEEEELLEQRLQDQTTTLKNAQDDYETNLRISKEREIVLNDFLDQSANITRPTKTEPSINVTTALNEEEEFAARKLQRQILDDIHTATTDEERQAALKELENFNEAVQNLDISRFELTEPDLNSQNEIDDTLQDNISERNTLLKLLSETTNPAEEEAIREALEDNEKQRLEINKNVFGLQDNLNYGTKVEVGLNEDGQYIIESYKTVDGSYEVTNENPKSLLFSDSEAARESIKTLNEDEYAQLRFTTSDQVFDSQTGRVIDKKDAEEGQPGRYTAIRPNIDDVDEYLKEGQQEVEDLETVFNATPEAVAYNEQLLDIEQTAERQREALNSQLQENDEKIFTLIYSTQTGSDKTQEKVRELIEEDLLLPRAAAGDPDALAQVIANSDYAKNSESSDFNKQAYDAHRAALDDILTEREILQRDLVNVDELERENINNLNSSAIGQQYRIEEQNLRVTQAATLIHYNRVAAATVSPVSDGELKAATQILQRANEQIDRTKNRFDTENTRFKNTMTAHANGNDDLTSAITAAKTNSIGDLESDTQQLYQRYVTQAENANPGMFNNYDELVQKINDDPNITQAEKNTLLLGINGIQNNYLSNSNVSDQLEPWNASQNDYTTALTNKEEAELNINRLSQAPNYDTVKASLDTALRSILETARDPEAIEAVRGIDDLDAKSFANSNKQLVNALFRGESQAPFYLQFPTLETITDFRLRNGFSPFNTAQSPVEVARDAIHVNIFAGALGDTSIEQVGDLKLLLAQSSANTTLGTFTIYPNDMDWLQFNHQHQYSDDFPLKNTANNVIKRGTSFVNGLKVFENLRRGETVTQDAASARVLGRFDYIDQYESTNKLNIDVPFVLFTKGNFIRDIFRPIMFLTALSYPKRILNVKDQLGENRGLQAIPIKNALVAGESYLSKALDFFNPNQPGVADSKENKTQKFAERLGEQLGETGSDAAQFLVDNLNLGALRFIIAQRPEYLSVRHASGLFFFKLAVIENFSYHFKGPWINSVGEVVDDVERAQRVFGGFLKNLNLNEYLLKIKERQVKMPYAFPSIAECRVSFKSVEPLFREDWLALLQGASDFSGRGLVRVSEQATRSFRAADGSKVNFNTITTEQRDLVEEGLKKYVSQAGQSISNILAGNDRKTQQEQKADQVPPPVNKGLNPTEEKELNNEYEFIESERRKLSTTETELERLSGNTETEKGAWYKQYIMRTQGKSQEFVDGFTDDELRIQSKQLYGELKARAETQRTNIANSERRIAELEAKRTSN